ncbi:hypothetical protein [Sphingomonas sp. ID0503]|uniref:hypothetical protein n=1 Tax=Sphingomonas sp. ID0503 TaxID=3399691 RepID=UPI003AFA73DE
MKIVSRPALVLALMLGTAATGAMIATPAVAKEKKEAKGAEPKLSKEARPLLAAAQTALGANDFATASAKLTEAQGVASTPDDKFYIGQLLYQVGQKQNDQATQMKGVELMTDSGSELAKANLDQMYLMQAQAAMNAKDYGKAEGLLTKANELKPDPNNMVALAEIKVGLKKNAEAMQLVEQAIAAKKAAGQQVDENWYKRALSIAYTAKDAPNTVKWGQLWVQAFPTPSNWRNALFSYRDVSALDKESELDLNRLARAAKALNGERDYYEYADYALQKGLPAEAKAVIDEGYAAKMLDASNKAATEIRTLAAPKVASDKASLPGTEKTARAGANGRIALNTADAYLGYADYAKAADLYKVALQKGGVDANVVNTRLGIALALLGQKDAAKQAFATVTGVRQPLAQYWTIWADQAPAA